MGDSTENNVTPSVSSWLLSSSASSQHEHSGGQRAVPDELMYSNSFFNQGRSASLLHEAAWVLC